MSRNLCSDQCEFCGKSLDPSKHTSIVLLEDPRPITNQEAGYYYPEYQNMLVANAECSQCHAKYLAWMSNVPHRSTPRFYYNEPNIQDLSFRSTFNDEPGPKDLPTHKLVPVPIQVGERLWGYTWNGTKWVDPVKK